MKPDGYFCEECSREIKHPSPNRCLINGKTLCKICAERIIENEKARYR